MITPLLHLDLPPNYEILDDRKRGFMFRFKSRLLKTARPADDLLKKRYNATDQEISLASQVDDDKFLEWVLKNYKKKSIQLPEDGAKLRDQLAWFSKMKNSPKFKEKYSPDINQYTPSTLYEAYSSDEMNSLQSQNQKDKEITNKGSKIVYNQDGVLVYEVHDYKALMLLSSNTNWCTAQEKYSKQYLESGPNYVIYYKNKPHAQYDPGTGQLMNPKDESMKVDVRRFKEVVSDPILLELGKVIPAFSKFRSISSFSEVKFRNALKKGDPRELVEICKLKGRWPEAEPIIMRDLWVTYEYARDIIKGRWPEAEPIIMEKPLHAYVYARDLIKGRWPEAEPYIMKDPAIAHDYARDFIKGRWPEAEPYIMKNPVLTLQYAKEVIKGHWPEAEPYIMKDPRSAYYYARDIIKGRWPEAEPIIMKHPRSAYYYAKDVIKGHWPEAEPIIMQSFREAYFYARDVIKGRWPEAEPYIMKDLSTILEYAMNVIKGRWPEAEPYLRKDKSIWNYYQKFLTNNQ